MWNGSALAERSRFCYAPRVFSTAHKWMDGSAPSARSYSQTFFRSHAAFTEQRPTAPSLKPPLAIGAWLSLHYIPPTKICWSRPSNGVPGSDSLACLTRGPEKWGNRPICVRDFDRILTRDLIRLGDAHGRVNRRSVRKVRSRDWPHPQSWLHAERRHEGLWFVLCERNEEPNSFRREIALR